MKKKIELFVSSMPKFSGNFDDENEVDNYVGGNFDKLAGELGIDLNDEKATEDAWSKYAELLDEKLRQDSISNTIAEFVSSMPPFTGNREASDELDDYVNSNFDKLAGELGIDLNDEKAIEDAWSKYAELLDEKLKQDNTAHNDLTSTGSTKEELGDAEDETTISDSREKRIAKMKRSWGKTRTQKQLEEEKEHDTPKAGGELFGPGATVSDATMKNIFAALTSHRF